MIRTFLYALACACAICAFALLLYPLATNLGNIRDFMGLMLTLGMTTAVAPFAIALAVIPLCIAFAFDKADE